MPGTVSAGNRNAQHRKGRSMTRVAETIKVHRVSLHRMLRKNGNPTFCTFLQLLGQFEIQLTARPSSRAA